MNQVIFILLIVLLSSAPHTILASTLAGKAKPSKISIEVFLDALRKLDFDGATEVLAGDPSWNDENFAGELLKLLTVSTGVRTDIEYEGNLPDKKLLFHLARGYFLKNESAESKLKAYQDFSEAIKISDENNLKNGLKFSLISMLDLLRREVFLGNDKFMPYLIHYKELNPDSTDELRIILYEIGLKSKENSDFKSVGQKEARLKMLDELFLPIPESNPLKARYYFEKAVQHKLVQEYDKAIYFLKRALSLSKQQSFNVEVHDISLWQLSSVYLEKKEIDSALHYLEASKSTAKDLKSKFYDARLEAWINSDLGKFDSAYYHLDKSIEYEYKLGAKNNSLESALLSVENQTEKLKLDKLRLDNRRKTNQNYLILALSFLAIGTITAIFLQKNTTKKRQLAEQTTLLEQQKVETLLKEQELVSIDAMIAGQEKERTKVANELHDDLGSLMATVKLHFDNVKVDQKDPALKNAKDLLEKAYQKIRGMAHAKNSGVMANQGLLPAVQKMARTINKTNALEVTVEDFGLADRMENSFELTIFRIIQELVANIIKHAEATKASIQFTQHEDKLNIIVEDNGKGFDMSSVTKSSSGMGLGSIEKRIEHLEGAFTVDSVLGKGTSILIDIPV